MVGVVVIGRNEGERLKICLESVLECLPYVVYVDSGSSDNSISIAKKLGVDIVALDMRIPFTAARARNAGVDRLKQQSDEIEFVQFVDGDCEMTKGWIQTASDYLDAHPNISVVCGRLRERYPEKSVYNTLCDIEWDTPVGEADACGGISMARMDVLIETTGFNPEVIAGEEPELCLRIRKKGWGIWRLGSEMGFHDADMLHFKQWWKRNVRSGYAFALGAHMHGSYPTYHWRAETRRTRLWALYLPALIVPLSIFSPFFIFLIFIYPFQVARLALNKRKDIDRNWVYAFYMTLCKFPELQGQLKFYFNQLFRSKSKIIEYKGGE